MSRARRLATAGLGATTVGLIAFAATGLAAVGLAAGFAPPAGADPPACVLGAPTCTPANTVGVDPGGLVSGLVGRLIGGVAHEGITAVLSATTNWVAKGASMFITGLFSTIDRASAPHLSAAWFVDQVSKMLWLAGLLVIPLLLCCAISAIIRQDSGQLTRAVFVSLPLAGGASLVCVGLTEEGLSLTDALSRAVAQGTGDNLDKFFTAMATALGHLSAGSTFGELAVLIVSMAAVTAAFLIFLELAVRAAAVYVAVLFLPLALAGLVWPATSKWAKRLVELLAVLLLSKFIVVAVLSLGASALGAASDGDLSAVVLGTALLFVAIFSPFTLLRLVPVVEAGLVSHLEGLGRRAVTPPPIVQSIAHDRLRQAIDQAIDRAGGTRSAPVSVGTVRQPETPAPPEPTERPDYGLRTYAGAPDAAAAAGVGTEEAAAGGATLAVAAPVAAAGAARRAGRRVLDDIDSALDTQDRP